MLHRNRYKSIAELSEDESMDEDDIPTDDIKSMEDADEITIEVPHETFEMGDFNLSDYESFFVEKRFEDLGFLDIFGKQRTYYFHPYNKFYSFDKTFVKGVKVKRSKVMRKFHRKIFRNNQKELIPDHTLFDHFGLKMNLTIN